MFCLKSRSTDCIIATSWAISSCLVASCYWSATSCSTLRRTRARSIATGLSRCPNSEEVSAVAGARANTQLSHGAQVLTSSLASPW
jgi:hypothetical protein